MKRRMLWKLPPDLQAMSWQWVPPGFRTQQHGSATWYTAVYARPFDRGADNDHFALSHTRNYESLVVIDPTRAAH